VPDHDILSSPQGRRLLQRALGELNLESVTRSGADDAIKRILTELRRARRARSRKLYAFWAAVLAETQDGAKTFRSPPVAGPPRGPSEDATAFILTPDLSRPASFRSPPVRSPARGPQPNRRRRRGRARAIATTATISRTRSCLPRIGIPRVVALGRGRRARRKPRRPCRSGERNTPPRPRSRQWLFTDDRRRSIPVALSQKEARQAGNGHALEDHRGRTKPDASSSTMGPRFMRSDAFRDALVGERSKGQQEEREPKRISALKSGTTTPAPVHDRLFSDASNRRNTPIVRSFPSVLGGSKPNPFGQQRLRLTNFPFGLKAEFLAKQIRRPPPSSAHAAALRMQAARAGLFYAAPRGTS
jgi:hypothetical protein